MDINTKIKLNNGINMPLFGLGTWKMKEQDIKLSLFHALKIGYKLIDTARQYKNEKAIGDLIKKSGIDRKELFITTKLKHNKFDVIGEYMQSLKRLRVKYIDLYLVHLPAKDKETRKKVWEQMELLSKKSKCKAIGVSNYNIEHIKELLNYAEIVPVVNQIKFNPYCNQKELMEFCEKNKIKIMGYSPLSEMQLGDSKIIQLAEKYSKTPAQIILKWSFQKGVITIPKSSNKNRIIENSQIFDFEIKKEDMKLIDSLNKLIGFDFIYSYIISVGRIFKSI
jgi:diketogulonate reductase-like aldo/keto reductase